IEVPIAESEQDPQLTPLWLDRWVPWIVGTVLLILVAYGPQLIDQIANIDLGSGQAPSIRPW
ncbi:MAG: cytochrome C, partial [Acidimicrobiia bacterium]|nr:cytochrome C [Acidimicrobiia bacterium]